MSLKENTNSEIITTPGSAAKGGHRILKRAGWFSMALLFVGLSVGLVSFSTDDRNFAIAKNIFDCIGYIIKITTIYCFI